MHQHLIKVSHHLVLMILVSVLVQLQLNLVELQMHSYPGSIADSKLNAITTANKVGLASLDIDGGTDIGAA